jgi:D-psicose/D-tagatose/L-ribulose 3-epimerase
MEAKLAVSSIAWQQNQESVVAQLMRNYKVRQVEIAPTKVWSDLVKENPLLVPPSDVREYIKFWNDYGITPIAMQSMLFLRPDLQLFDDQKTEETVDYLKKFIQLAGRLGVQRMVFGSPKNRLRNENESYESQMLLAVEIFSELGRTAVNEGVVFCIEPNPEAYGCNFVINAKEGRDLVQRVNSAGFGLHLDAAGMTLAGDNPYDEIIASANVLQHFHVSEPYLNPVKDDSNVKHNDIVRALEKIDYKKTISIEMKPSVDDAQNFANVATAIDYARNTYRVS